MRLYCLSTLSILVVIVATLSGGDCALSAPGKRRRDAKQDGLHSPSDETRKLKKPCYEKDMEQSFEGATGSLDVIEIAETPLLGVAGPKVLMMDRVEFEGLDKDRKMELTKDLTAGDWNELLGKLWVEEEDYEKNVSIMCYTLQYAEGRRLEMFEEALTAKLDHLFAAMCGLAYVPRNPKVMAILERGLKAYPALRQLILPTMYQLGYPVTKWHLDNPEEDLMSLEHAIESGLIGREAIAGHFAEVVTLYPLTVLEALLAKNLATMRDVCTMKICCKVCGRGGTKYLQWAKNNCDLRPDQECINAAVSNGQEPVVDFIANELGMTMVPSQKAVDKAAANGKLALLVNKCHVWGLFPSRYGANKAAKNGHLRVLKWMAALEPAKRRVYPSQDGVNNAAKKGT